MFHAAVQGIRDIQISINFIADACLGVLPIRKKMAKEEIKGSNLI